MTLKPPAKELRLVFGTPEKAQELSAYYQIDWPQIGNRLSATLDTFESGGISEVGEIYSRFITANTPQDSKILFAIRTEQGKGDFERSMQSFGDPLQEVILPTRKSWFSRTPREERILAGSTTRSEIVSKIFQDYDLEWYTQSQFWFVISSKDFPYYWEQLFELLGKVEKPIVRSATIENSHTVMTTLWEHGIEILSNKVQRTQLEQTAREIADEHQLRFIIEGE